MAAGRPSLAQAILLELVPLISLISAYATALLTMGTGAWILALVAALGFGVSGLGWFYVGKTAWGWEVFCGRLIVVVTAIAMGFSVLLSALRCFDSSAGRCAPGNAPAGPGGAFVWATAVVWMIAALSPIASAIALAIWLRRQPPAATP